MTERKQRGSDSKEMTEGTLEGKGKMARKFMVWVYVAKRQGRNLEAAWNGYKEKIQKKFGGWARNGLRGR